MNYLRMEARRKPLGLSHLPHRQAIEWPGLPLPLLVFILRHAGLVGVRQA